MAPIKKPRTTVANRSAAAANVAPAASVEAPSTMKRLVQLATNSWQLVSALIGIVTVLVAKWRFNLHKKTT